MPGRRPISLHDPRPALLDFPVHGIRGEVQIIGPSDCAQRHPSLTEQPLVPQRRKDACRRRIKEARKFDCALGTVIKTYVKPKSVQDFKARNASGRSRPHRRPQLSGAIFFGIFMRAHRINVAYGHTCGQ